jgi:hypothetical protein
MKHLASASIVILIEGSHADEEVDMQKYSKFGRFMIGLFERPSLSYYLVAS